MRLDSNGFNNKETELETSKDFAEALVVMMGASTDFKMAFESCGFAPSVEEAFDKGLQKCIDAISCAVPNQYRMKVLRMVRKAADKADEQLETRTNLAADQVSETRESDIRNDIFLDDAVTATLPNPQAIPLNPDGEAAQDLQNANLDSMQGVRLPNDNA